ncbi:probable carboxylesterase 2 [Nymphaea colorata]|uniref:probable carboxylesterase 2 n=1 Tax=Nymphaea colorata TaxID=210225 RepID=UPI00129EBB77|nr:probable carboxylesterase 2 [Nymphaea colorata]
MVRRKATHSAPTHSLWSMDSSAELIGEVPGFIRLYQDGRVERLNGNQRVPPSTDHHTTGVSSKDVLIDPETGLSARLYLPPLSGNHHRRPLLIYFHGGGFFMGSAFSPLFHNYLNSLVAETGAVAVSVEYRLAPEHPAPICHHDCWAAFQWVARQTGPGTEPWVADHADLGRIVLAGDSAGANLVHHVAMRAGGASAVHGSGPPIEDPVKTQGILLVHPYFSSSTLLEGELPESAAHVELIWKLACPASPGVDDPIMNPLAVGSPFLNGLGCRRVLVSIAGNDFLRGRGRWFFEALTASGWKGEAEVEGKEHVFHLFRPEDEKAKLLLKRFALFIKGD